MGTRIISNTRQSNAFYHGLLGFPILNRPDFKNSAGQSVPGLWLNMGNVQLHLVEADNARFEAMHDPKSPKGRSNHIALETTEFDAILTRIERSGRQHIIVHVPHPAGGETMRQMFLPDPDGHYVEICECYKLHDFVYDTGSRRRRL